jgi:hypothetical protein
MILSKQVLFAPFSYLIYPLESTDSKRIFS